MWRARVKQDSACAYLRCIKKSSPRPLRFSAASICSGLIPALVLPGLADAGPLLERSRSAWYKAVRAQQGRRLSEGDSHQIIAGAEQSLAGGTIQRRYSGHVHVGKCLSVTIFSLLQA